jgi:hypothetical protein
MKIIINEYHVGLIRRISEIERLIDPIMDEAYDFLRNNDVTKNLNKREYRLFENTVVMVLANKLANQTQLQGDEKVMLRNQLQRYITNEYQEKIRDYFNSMVEN